jgi:lipoyl(octanoyl) transferase
MQTPAANLRVTHRSVEASEARVQAQPDALTVHTRGRVDYTSCWQAMRAFTAQRDRGSADELWLVEHAPVFTLGLAGRPEHVLSAGDIPIVRSDRGGQVTYHGPGQVVAYVLVDLKRRGLTVRALVQQLEQSVIDILQAHRVDAARMPGAPGVYVAGAKIAALGIRIARGCSYHGLALNVDMDLQPFERINPCGYPGMRVTQTRDLGIRAAPAEMAARLGRTLTHHLTSHFTQRIGCL